MWAERSTDLNGPTEDDDDGDDDDDDDDVDLNKLYGLLLFAIILTNRSSSKPMNPWEIVYRLLADVGSAVIWWS